MPRDKLAALKACQDQDEFSSIEMHDLGSSNPASVEQFHLEAEQLNASIDRLAENVDDVKKTHSMILSTPQIDDHVKKHLESVMADIQSSATAIKRKLEEMARQNEVFDNQDKCSAEYRIRKTQQNLLTHRFSDVMNDYHSTQADYRDRCKNRIQRQLEITGKVTTDDEIEDMIEAGDFAVFTREIQVETKQAKQSLAEIEARHNDIMKLEKSIRELRDLFVDLATLVEAQGDMVDRIENHVAESKSRVVVGAAEVVHAVAYKARSQLKKYICLTIIALIVIAITVATIYT